MIAAANCCATPSWISSAINCRWRSLDSNTRFKCSLAAANSAACSATLCSSSSRRAAAHLRLASRLEGPAPPRCWPPPAPQLAPAFPPVPPAGVHSSSAVRGAVITASRRQVGVAPLPWRVSLAKIAPVRKFLGRRNAPQARQGAQPRAAHPPSRNSPHQLRTGAPIELFPCPIEF